MKKQPDIPKPEAFRVCTSPLEVKADNGKRVIEGYASTSSKDDYNEIVLPTAFAEYLPQYLEFPLLLVNHEYRDKPIGKITLAEIRDDGLYVEAEISKTTQGSDVWTLIKDGVLKAFSIGFYRIAEEVDRVSGITTITKLRLVEISIVNIPANRQALIQSAEKRGLNLFRETKPPTTKRKYDMDPTETEKLIDDAMKAESVKVAASVAESVEKAFTPKIEAIKTELGSDIKAIQDAAANALTDTDKKQIEANVKAMADEFEEKLKAMERKYAASQRGEYFVTPEVIEDEAKDHPLGLDFARKLYTPSEQWGCHKAQHEEWSDALNQLALVYTCMKGGKHFRGLKNLKSWAKFEKIDAEFTKAISATVSGYGDEWVPTLMSANLINLIEAELVVGSLFPVVPMPSNPWDVPILTGHPSIYLYDEATVDYAAAIRRSSMGTGKRTMTAVGLAGASIISRDATEDSIIASVPLLQDQLIKGWVRALDDAIINGDHDDATHRDTQHSMASYDHRRAFNGLRYLANADGKEYDCQTVSEPNTAKWEAYDIMEMLKLHGNVAANLGGWSTNIVLLMSLNSYLTAMTWTPVMTAGQAGQRATIQVGPDGISTIYGVPVLTSEFIRDDYSATGLYDNTGQATSLCLSVYKPAFWRGTRRAFELESEKIIDTQQTKVVGTTRQAFREMRANTAEYVCVAGINIPT